MSSQNIPYLSCPHCRKPLRHSHVDSFFPPNTIIHRAVKLIQDAGAEGITRHEIFLDIYGKNPDRWPKAVNQSFNTAMHRIKRTLRENGYDILDGRKTRRYVLYKLPETKPSRPKVKDSEGINGAI